MKKLKSLRYVIAFFLVMLFFTVPKVYAVEEGYTPVSIVIDDVKMDFQGAVYNYYINSLKDITVPFPAIYQAMGFEITERTVTDKWNRQGIYYTITGHGDVYKQDVEPYSGLGSAFFINNGMQPKKSTYIEKLGGKERGLISEQYVLLENIAILTNFYMKYDAENRTVYIKTKDKWEVENTQYPEAPGNWEPILMGEHIVNRVPIKNGTYLYLGESLDSVQSKLGTNYEKMESKDYKNEYVYYWKDVDVRCEVKDNRILGVTLGEGNSYMGYTVGGSFPYGQTLPEYESWASGFGAYYSSISGISNFTSENDATESITYGVYGNTFMTTEPRPTTVGFITISGYLNRPIREKYTKEEFEQRINANTK